MSYRLSVHERINDDVALYDITRQTAKAVLALMYQELDASSDATETEYWRVRIAGVRETEAALKPDLPALQILAQQDRWLAEAHYLDTVTSEKRKGRAE